MIRIIKRKIESKGFLLRNTRFKDLDLKEELMNMKRNGWNRVRKRERGKREVNGREREENGREREVNGRERENRPRKTSYLVKI